jgi:hypothetical protein
MKNRKSIREQGFIVIAIIALITLVEILNHDLLMLVLLIGTFLFVVFLFAYHKLNEKGKW